MLKLVLLCPPMLKYVKIVNKIWINLLREDLHKPIYESLVSTHLVIIMCLISILDNIMWGKWNEMEWNEN